MNRADRDVIISYLSGCLGTVSAALLFLFGVAVLIKWVMG